MLEPDLTPAQATDLARYTLGPDWIAGIAQTGLRYLMQSGTHGKPTVPFFGASWRDVFRHAGAEWRGRKRYTAHGSTVLCDGDHVASARSSNLALRIAKALNAYIPNDRGR